MMNTSNKVLGDFVTVDMYLNSLDLSPDEQGPTRRQVYYACDGLNFWEYTRRGRTLLIDKRSVDFLPLAYTSVPAKLAWPAELAELAIASLQTVAGAAYKLGVTEQTIYNHIKSGQLISPDLRDYGVIGRLVIVDRDHISPHVMSINGWRLDILPTSNGGVDVRALNESVSKRTSIKISRDGVLVGETKYA